MAVKEGTPKNLGVLLIDFNPVVREGLQAILTKDEGIEVIGDVPDGHEALQHIKRAGDRGRPVNVVLTETEGPAAFHQASAGSIKPLRLEWACLL